MVRSASTRSTKYEKKLRGSVWNARFEALKDMMTEQVNYQYPIQVFYENKIKAYLEGVGIYGLQIHSYMNYGMRLWALGRTFSQNTLRNEAIEEANKWLRRGLNPTYLTRIARLFGINLVGFP